MSPWLVHVPYIYTYLYCVTLRLMWLQKVEHWWMHPSTYYLLWKWQNMSKMCRVVYFPVHGWAVELGCDPLPFVATFQMLLSTYESPHPYKIKKKENQLFRTIHSVWWVHWLCLGAQRVVGVLTQLLYWVQDASGMYVPSTHLLFSRSQHIIDSRNCTLQNFKKACLT